MGRPSKLDRQRQSCLKKAIEGKRISNRKSEGSSSKLEMDDDVLIINGHQEEPHERRYSCPSSSCSKSDDSELYQWETPKSMPLIHKNVGVTLHQLKLKQVMSPRFRRIHKLQRSNVALICRQLMNLDRKGRKLKMEKLGIQEKSDPGTQDASTSAEEDTGIPATNPLRRIKISRSLMSTEKDDSENRPNLPTNVQPANAIDDDDVNDTSTLMDGQNKIASMSIQTPSGVHSIAVRSVRIFRKLSTALKDSSPLSDSTINEIDQRDHGTTEAILSEPPKQPLYDENTKAEPDESQSSSKNTECPLSMFPSVETTTETEKQESQTEAPTITNAHSVIEQCSEEQESVVESPSTTKEKSEEQECVAEAIPTMDKGHSVSVKSSENPESEHELPVIANVHSVSDKSPQKPESEPELPIIANFHSVSEKSPQKPESEAEISVVTDIHSGNEKSQEPKCVESSLEMNTSQPMEVEANPPVFPFLLEKSIQESIYTNLKIDNVESLSTTSASSPDKSTSLPKIGQVKSVSAKEIEELDCKFSPAKAILSSPICERRKSPMNTKANTPLDLSTTHIIPEADIAVNDSNDCFIIQKVESVSSENAESLFNAEEAQWDYGLLPSQFLQCDMEVNDSGNSIYKDNKLLMRPVVRLEKTTVRKISDPGFWRGTGISSFSQAYCRSMLKVYRNSLKTRGPNSKKRTSKILLRKEDSHTILESTKHLILRGLLDDANADKTVRPTKPDPIKKKHTTKTIDVVNVDSGMKDHVPGRGTVSAPLRSGSGPRKRGRPRRPPPVYIRPKPLSELLERGSNVSQKVDQQMLPGPSKWNICPDQPVSQGPMQAIPLDVAQGFNLVPTPPAPTTSTAINLDSLGGTTTSHVIPPVGNYALTHSIFGTLVDNDKSSTTMSEPQEVTHIPCHPQLPPSTQPMQIVQKSVVGQFPPGAMPFPMYTGGQVVPVTNTFPPNLERTYQPHVKTSFPLSSPLILPPSLYNRQTVRAQTVEFERPLLLLQQPYIPVQGGGIQPKERAEEEYRSVPLKCSGIHVFPTVLMEQVCIILKQMKVCGFPDTMYSLQNTAYQIFVARGACCLTQAVAIVNSDRFRRLMQIPMDERKCLRPAIPCVRKVLLKFFPGYKMFVLKRFTFAVNSTTREVIFPMPPFCVPKETADLTKITLLLLVSPSDGFGPGLVVLPHVVLTTNLRQSLNASEPPLSDWGLSGHSSGGLTRTIVHEYLLRVALPWISSIKSQQWENYLLVDKWWAVDELSIPSEFAGFHTFGLHQMYKTNYDPLDVFFNMTLQRMWGVLHRKFVNLHGPLKEELFPKFFIESIRDIYSDTNIADFCAQSGLYPIDMNRAHKFTQQDFYY